MFIPDPWTRLRRHTPARIALGRAGASLPTAELLAFAADHAAARDAVHSELDLDALEADVRPLGLEVVRLKTAVSDRRQYLQRPDLGRQLDADSRQRLSAVRTGADVALLVADGLSALAAQTQAPAVLAALVPRLRASGLTPAPLAVVRFGRVAVEDEVGVVLGARAALILLGERPGLGSADSLGAYLIYDPRPGRTDAERNCVSNIRPAGLAAPAAADLLHYLLTESLRRRLSGVGLKDERPALPPSIPSLAADRLEDQRRPDPDEQEVDVDEKPVAR